MNRFRLRACNVFLRVVLFVFSCKPDAPEEAVSPNLCKPVEFAQSGITYAFKYDSGKLPVTLSRIRGGGAGYPTLFFEYLNEKLSTVFIEIDGSKYPKTIFDYQSGRLSRIQQFSASRTDATGTSVEVAFQESVEFQYASGDKPSGLTRWLQDDDGNLVKSHESVFEYNAEGDLVTERMHVFARPNVQEADYRYTYSYDNQPNTRKPLHAIFFAAAESAPLVFSKHNMNRLTIQYDGKIMREQAFKLTYDPNGNVTADGYQYSGISWDCK